MSLFVSCRSRRSGEILKIVRIEKTESKLIPISSYGFEFLIKEKDTIHINNLLCSDSVLFTQLFSEVIVDGICLEANLQGKTYYAIEIDQNGKFKKLNTVKSVHNCFNSTTAQIQSILDKKHVLQKEYYDSELIFYHKFRIEKSDN